MKKIQCKRISFSYNFKVFSSLIFILFIQNCFAVSYYVNDDSKEGDIYTTAIGNDENTGKLPSLPKKTLKAVYEIAQDGDEIYIDTGSYSEIDEKGIILFEQNKKIKIIWFGNKSILLSKKEIPVNQKTNPEIFYIYQDQPVDKETYMKKMIEANSNKKE